MLTDSFERGFFFLLNTMGLPPGLAFLSLHIPQVVGPPLFVYLASHLATAAWGLTIPTWLLTVAYVASWPLALTVIIQYSDWKTAREAAAIGAELPPRIPSERLGGWDLVKRINDTLENRIMGECLISPQVRHPLTPAPTIVSQAILFGIGLRHSALRTISAFSLKTGWVLELDNSRSMFLSVVCSTFHRYLPPNRTTSSASLLQIFRTTRRVRSSGSLGMSESVLLTSALHC